MSYSMVKGNFRLHKRHSRPKISTKNVRIMKPLLHQKGEYLN